MAEEIGRLEPAIIQHWRAANSPSGNPQRCYVIWSKEGKLLDVIDEGYAGRPRWTDALVDLGSVEVSKSTYHSMLKHAVELRPA